MSLKQMRFQVTPKLIRPNSWIKQTARQRIRIPNCWARNGESTSAERSLKVIGTDEDRSATYDFVLKFRSNIGPISYRFRDKRRFQSKIANFLTPRLFNTHAHGVPLELGTGVGIKKKLAWWGLLGREGNLTTYSAIWINYTKWQTDGRTPNNSKYHVYVSG